MNSADKYEEITQVIPADILLLEACKLRQRTTTKMRAVKWPPDECPPTECNDR